MKRVICGMGMALLAAGVAGCDSAVAVGAEGSSEMRVGVRGDESPAATRQQDFSASRSGEASGRIEVEARVYVQAATGGWVELTEGAARQTVEASGSDGVKALATATVDAGTYRRVRVEFERVEARASVWAELGGGLITGTVRVDGGSDGRVIVERELRLEARGDATTELVIDLNADQWCDEAAASGEMASEAEFREAVRIVAR